MLQYPGNLNEEQKQDWEKAWFSVFNIMMAFIKILVLAVILILGIAMAGDSLDGMLAKVEPVSQKEQGKRKKTLQVDDFDLVENGIHVQTGLVFADGFNDVRATCTACHSAKLVTQNRATRDG